MELFHILWGVFVFYCQIGDCFFFASMFLVSLYKWLCCLSDVVDFSCFFLFLYPYIPQYFFRVCCFIIIIKYVITYIYIFLFFLGVSRSAPEFFWREILFWKFFCRRWGLFQHLKRYFYIYPLMFIELTPKKRLSGLQMAIK